MQKRSFLFFHPDYTVGLGITPSHTLRFVGYTTGRELNPALKIYLIVFIFYHYFLFCQSFFLLKTYPSSSHFSCFMFWSIFVKDPINCLLSCFLILRHLLPFSILLYIYISNICSFLYSDMVINCFFKKKN